MKLLKQDKIYITILIGIFLAFCIRIHFGVVSNDESVYLAIPYRILSGDAILSQEWNLSQLSGLILLPFLFLYNMFFSTYDGVYLFFRYVYIFILLAVAMWSFIYLRQNNKKLCYIAPILFMTYVPYGLFALSYNSMTLIFCYIIFVILQKKQVSNIQFIIIGMLWALSVLCIPYFAILYFIFFILCLIIKKNDIFNLRSLLFVTVGILIIFIYFLIVLFHNNSIEDILLNLKYLLNDPTHQTKTLNDYIYPIKNFIIGYKYALSPLPILLIIFIFKKSKITFGLIVTYLSVLMLYLAIIRSYGFELNAIGKNIIPLITSLMVLIPIFAGYKLQRNELITYITIILLALLFHVASNQGLFVISILTIISCSLTYKIMLKHFKDIKIRKMIYLLFIVQIVCQLIVNVNNIYHDGKIFTLNTKIDFGSMKGVYTTSENVESYSKKYNDLQNKENERILVFKNMPYAYLDARSFVGSYSVWNETDSLNSYMFKNYYELHPDMIPEYIYIAEENVDLVKEEIDNYCIDNNYEINELDSGAILLVGR